MSASTLPARNLAPHLRRVSLRRGLAFGVIIVLALLAFEFFNYSTTVFALKDLLGELSFLGVQWATILAIAFCGIDFAGIARLFTPEDGTSEPNEVWYLFAAWLLAATMNAMLTWWGVSIAILNHESLGNRVISQEQLLKVVPIFVAVMVWLIRFLIIGTFSLAGGRLFSQGERPLSLNGRRLGGSLPAAKPQFGASATFHPSPRPGAASESAHSAPEPTYHPLSLSARPPRNTATRPKG